MKLAGLRKRSFGLGFHARVASLIFVSIILGATSFANLPRSAVNSVGVTLYGVFTTADPTCQNSLVASLPLSKTPITSNFAVAPILGAGSVPTKIACVVLVLANKIQINWSAASYSGSDSVCSAGGSASVNTCVGTAVSWPALITSSAQAIGLSIANSCSVAPTGNEIVPVFMSVNSNCTGNSVIDQNITGCSISGKSTSSVAQAPSTTNSTSSGARIPSTQSKGRIVFAVDPDQIVSGNGGVCGLSTAPVFSIHQ